MTDGGNHGGSSYEETDSLALFIGGDALDSRVHNSVLQVDITPTLALLLGVPIPKNNVGVVLFELLSSLTDIQKLRALELNSWQLLRLLQAHLPGLLCGDSDCHNFQVSGSAIQEDLCHSFSKATSAHKLYELNLRNASYTGNNTGDVSTAVTLYYEFLRKASQWLSHRATNKPIALLLSGVSIMVISFILLVNLLSNLLIKVPSTWKKNGFGQKECGDGWNLAEVFVLFGVSIHVFSLGASSMVEEEQYTWHFLASTLYIIFLFMAVQSLIKQLNSGLVEVMEEDKMHALRKAHMTSSYSSGNSSAYSASQLKIKKEYYQLISVLIVLICGRILRAWHQGGVNWVHLPDVSKWLEQTGTYGIMYFQTASLLLLGILYLCSASLIKSRSYLVSLVMLSNVISGLLVMLHIMETRTDTVLMVNYSSTAIAQILYLTVIVTAGLTLLLSPWILPIHIMSKPSMSSDSVNISNNSLCLSIQNSTYMIGITYIMCWCLLQLLLQQPINDVPVMLICLQLSSSVFFFNADASRHKQWVQVAALYFLGMAGHFGLGNSNTLATVDVAGAFIGISSHSTVLSGILMFIITYASPLLSYFTIVMLMPTRDMKYSSSSAKSTLGSILQNAIAIPCLLPLVLNSIVLTAFTIILLLMRNHLFVWSVFSPKYLYVCAATLSVYIGVFIIAATGFYVSTVFFHRANKFKSKTAKP